MLESTAGGATVLTAGFKREFPLPPETAGMEDYPWPVQETSAGEETAPPVSRLIKQEYPAGRPVSATCSGGVKREYGAGDAMETSSADYYSSSGSTASPQPPAKVGICSLTDPDIFSKDSGAPSHTAVGSSEPNCQLRTQLCL